jgi:hypothetical protein
MNSRGTLVLTLSLLSMTATLTRADWPAQRHDAARTSTGDGTSRIARPAITFRHALGGALGTTQLLTDDVNGDGAREVLLVVAGALVAKTSEDFVVWETGILDLFRLDALADLDGNGTQEIIASAAGGRVYVIDARTGAVLWTLPNGIIGNVGAVRLADFNRDGNLDVYVAEYANGSSGSLGDVGRAYSFAESIATPTMIFELERGRRDYVSGENDTIADIDGDGQLEVIAEGTHSFYVYSGVDGRLISASDSVGSIPFGHALLEVANVDGDAQPELIAYTDNAYAPPTNSRRVFLMDWDTTLGKLVLRWERSVPDLLRDRHVFGPGGVADLGNDGTLEVVTSFYDAATASWTTRVLDAATGTERASAPHGPFRGLADLDGDGSPEVTTGDHTTGTTVLRWTGSALATMFSAPRFEPLVVRRRDATAPSAATNGLLAFDLARTGTNALLGLAYSADDTRATALIARSGSADAPVEVARLALETNVAVLMAATTPAITRAYPQIVIARSDGYLWFLDDTLHATNAAPMAAPPRPGLRVGGYYSGPNGMVQVPLAADLDGVAGAELVVRDSSGALQRLSPLRATLVEPARVDWEIPNARTPLLVDLDGDTRPEVVYWTTDVAAQLRAVRASDIVSLWQRTLGATDVTPINDLMAGDVDGNGQTDIVYSLYASSGGTMRINALHGASGASLWPADYETVVAGTGYGAGSLWDRDGDGAVDVLACPRNLLQWIQGQDGTVGASIAAGYPDYAIIRDVGDGDPAPELTISGTVFDVHSYELDLTERWATTPGTQHTRVEGAIADCPTGGPVFVEGHNSSPRLSTWSLATGELVGDIALRGGVAWGPPSTVPEGAGRLGNVTVSRNLTGNGRPGVLVPSTDGYLYAVDPCAMTLDWALDFHAPVGEAILADTDGDGEDEIVVTVADGFLYGIDREVTPAPAFVYENNGTTLATSAAEDIDEFVTVDTLHANWAPVAGATSYEYAVLAAGGTFVTVPDFLSAGPATSASPSGLPLISGNRYYFAVRAIGPDGSSSEALSDGVIVYANACDACTALEHCVAGVCVPDPCAGVSCDVGLSCVEGTCIADVDAGTPPDLDAGTVSDADAGTEPDTDAGTPPGTDAGHPPGIDAGAPIRGRLVCWGDGCNCCCSVIPNRSGDRPAFALMAGLGMLVMVRRRRRR